MGRPIKNAEGVTYFNFCVTRSGFAPRIAPFPWVYTHGCVISPRRGSIISPWRGNLFIAQGKRSVALGKVAEQRWRPTGAIHKKAIAWVALTARHGDGRRVTQRVVRCAHFALGYKWFGLSARIFPPARSPKRPKDLIRITGRKRSAAAGPHTT